MKSAFDIIEQLANEKRVEQIVRNITRCPLDNPNMQDLVQLVYTILLEYDAEKIVELYDNGQINFFIVRIIINQYRSRNSTYYCLFKKFLAQSKEVASGFDVVDKDTEK